MQPGDFKTNQYSSGVNILSFSLATLGSQFRVNSPKELRLESCTYFHLSCYFFTIFVYFFVAEILADVLPK